MKLVKAVVLLLALSPLATFAGYIAKRNFEHQPVTLFSGSPASEAQVREAIVRGSVIRGWRVREIEAGKMEASIDVRGKHQLFMEIQYKEGEISLIYKSSVNLESRGLIHDKYLMWATNLIKDIQGEAYKMEFDKK